MSGGVQPNAPAPVFTRAGLAALRTLRGTGLLGTIDRIAVGVGRTANGRQSGYTPTGEETALAGERDRVPLLQGSRIGTGLNGDPLGFRVLARVPPTQASAYDINEVGFLLEGGTLLALWSDPRFPLGSVTPAAAFDLAFALYLQALPAANLTIRVVEPDVPDTLAALAELLRGHARQSIAINEQYERLALRNL